MPDYSKGKIYTIRNRNDDTKIYVGSTIQPLAVRFAGHKRDSKTERCKTFKLYIEVNNDWDNWYIELYENKSCNNKEELCKREGEIIREIGTLNSRIAGRDDKQYYIENADKIKQYYFEKAELFLEKNKQYYIENAEKLREYKRQYYIDNADKIKNQIKQYRVRNSEKIKELNQQYYIEKSDKIKEQKKQYYIKNADKIKEQRKQYYLNKKLNKKLNQF